MAYLDKVKINDTTYDIQDTVLKGEVADLKSAIMQNTQNINIASAGRYRQSGGSIGPTTNQNYCGMSDKIQCKPSTEYVFSVFGINYDSAAYYLDAWDADEQYIGNTIYYNVSDKYKKVTTVGNAAYMAIVIYSPNGVTIDNPKIMITEGSTVYTDYIPHETAKDILAETAIKNLSGSVKDKFAKVDGKFGTFLTECFEIGNISMSASGWTYGTGSGPTRVRTKNNLTLRLKANTIVGLTDYTDAHFYIGMRQNDGTYENHGWLTNDYTIPKDCDCVILIKNKTEVSQSSPLPLALLFFGYSFTDYMTQNKYIDYDAVVKNINHRGYNSVAPENTLPAYHLSKLMGFNIVETDVAFTSDGVPVCIHDSTINRTARNADGTSISETITVSGSTYNELLNYDFGIWKSAVYAGTKIPTFEQFLSLCKKIGLSAYVEIKTDQTYTESQIHGLMDLAKSTGMYDRITWISFLPTYLSYVKSYDANAKMIYVVSAVTDEVILNANGLKNNGNLLAINAQLSVLTSEGLQKAVNANIPLEVWTVNQENVILNLSPYITGVTSDYTIAGKVLYERNIYLD